MDVYQGKQRPGGTKGVTPLARIASYRQIPVVRGASDRYTYSRACNGRLRYVATYT